MAKLVFGCGYLGRRVADLWRDRGETVYAVTRSPARAAEFAASGLRPIVAELGGATELTIPQEVRTVLFAVGYDRTCGQSIHDVYVGGLERALAALPFSVERMIYISSTGVYGHVTGAEVDEASRCEPVREGGQACLAAEGALQQSFLAGKSIVLRLAGIYGPGRIPRAKDLLAGQPIDAPATGSLNLIHVDDAAQIVVLADQRAPLPSLYVVSDGQPVHRGDYYRELASLLGAPPPRFVEPAGNSPAAQRAGSDKRVNPRRLMAELSPQLKYPSYREGLAAIVAAEHRPDERNSAGFQS